MHFAAYLKEARNLWDPYPYQRYLRRGRFVFVHIPKNGGTSILQALGTRPGVRLHVPWFVYRQSNRFFFESFFKFTVVRNPWDRLVSVYSYLSQGGAPNTDARLAADIRARAPTFAAFVNDYLDPSRLSVHSLFRPQVYYVCNEFLEPMVDMVCRFERFETDVEPALARVGVPRGRLQPLNRSRRGDYRDYYPSAELVERVRTLYRQDCEVFGYRFGE